ncbi:hypothetical protein PVL29_024355 [Vitis rotundifolia]|uniref:MRN complex-interacting protein N-terminal domain-containing protein n=1 Tax=Vitis rotundifolia TaxID=103349 RepID=A0AA38YRN7_VITRO|nr:hypothetical protein PVL29_024355 [Vitis rotundifolia]
MGYGWCFFQVKQQKKNSNKWTCVVCNEKQSVRKVYAQGSMAKDVRKFVQSFNMSLKFIDEEENLTVMVADGEEAGGSCSGNGKKRRSDWSEYLDPEEEEEERGADMEGEIVTEMPKEMLKNQNQSTGSQSRDRGGKEPLKPLFPKRNTTNRPTISLEDTTETAKAKAKRRTSKWSEYLTEEENEEAMAMATAVDNEAAAITHSQMVEEEIHPDFM